MLATNIFECRTIVLPQVVGAVTTRMTEFQFSRCHRPDELKHAWLRALHREDVDELKVVYVCSKHFREEDIEYIHRVPNGDGSYREKPRSRPKLIEGAVPAILPECPLYYSSHSTNKRSRLSRECNDDKLLNQALTLIFKSEVEENERFNIQSFQELQDKLYFLYIHKTWSLWYPDECTLIIMRPGFHNRNIEVDTYLSVEFDLSVKAYFKGEMFSIS